MHYCWPLELIISAFQLRGDTIVDCVTDYETQVVRRKFLREFIFGDFHVFRGNLFFD